MASVSVIKSTRGCDLLVVDNFSFSKQDVLKSGEVRWRCIKKNLKCLAKLYTVGPEFTVTRSDLIHNHEPDQSALQRKIITTACKRKAQEDVSEKPSKIIKSVLSTNLPDELTTTDVTLIRRNMYNSRRKLLPTLPKDIHQVHIAVDMYAPKTTTGENFLFINCAAENIIVFSCQTNITTLCKMNVIYMDGTFSFCTKYFYQLFTIHGLENGHYIPLLYCLLPNKTTETYTKLFLLLKSKILEAFNTVFEPVEAFVDFEIAIHIALRNVLPKTKINGCRFHLHQAWFRKIQSLGLTQIYKDKNCEESKWLVHTFGLTYLKPSEVEDCFIFDLMSYKPNNEQLDKYADYLLHYFIGPDSYFSPNIWADENPTIKRTTNACESFHSKFNSSFYSSHPSIFVFIEKLKEFQIEAYLKIKSLNITAKIKDKQVQNKLKFIENMVNMLRSGNISRIDFVKAVSHQSL